MATKERVQRSSPSKRPKHRRARETGPDRGQQGERTQRREGADPRRTGQTPAENEAVAHEPSVDRSDKERSRTAVQRKRLAQIPRFSGPLGKRQIRGCQKTACPDPPIFAPARKTPNQGVPKNALPRSPDFRPRSENAKSGGAKKRLAQIPRFSPPLGKRQIRGCQKTARPDPPIFGPARKTPNQGVRKTACPDPPIFGPTRKNGVLPRSPRSRPFREHVKSGGSGQTRLQYRRKRKSLLDQQVPRSPQKRAPRSPRFGPVSENPFCPDRPVFRLTPKSPLVSRLAQIARISLGFGTQVLLKQAKFLTNQQVPRSGDQMGGDLGKYQNSLGAIL